MIPGDPHSAVRNEQGLARQLSTAQQAAMALGGAIGTGLFLASGLAVNVAGPAVILSYAVVAAISLLLGRALAEMAVAHPTAGAFGVYAGMYLSPFAGYAMRMSYLLMEVIAKCCLRFSQILQRLIALFQRGTMTLRSAALLLLALSLSACASAPPATPPPKPAPAPAQFPTIDLLCSEGARYVSFDKLSVPGRESPVDVALTHGSIWVLFPQRLVQIGRGGDHVSVRTQLAPSEDAWAKLDVDPVDESVWVASQSRPVLFKITPDGKTMSIVKLPKIEGKGGFSSLVVARDAIYAQPTCADAAVWRIDRSGKVLGTAFPAPKPAQGEAEVLQAGKPQMDCFSMRVDRDAEGQLLAWNLTDRKTWQVDGQGAWTPSASHLFEHLPGDASALTLRGVAFSQPSEHWSVDNGVGKLFYWKGKPALLGRERSASADTMLFLPDDAGIRQVLMSCHKAYVREVATDATGYAAITDRFLVLGETAGAPELP
jgi:hypothetical protein